MQCKATQAVLHDAVEHRPAWPVRDSDSDSDAHAGRAGSGAAHRAVLPPGLLLHPALIDRATEQAVLALVHGLPLHQARYKVYTARRRVLAWRRADDLARADAASHDHPRAAQVASAGLEGRTAEPDHASPAEQSDRAAGAEQPELEVGSFEQLPPALQALRAQLAAFAGIAPEDFAHAMVTGYTPGTPLGWHRDAPQYGLVVGVSLASAACLRFRPHDPAAPQRRLPRDNVLQLELAPRSAYVMRGPARWAWQHSIAPVPALRYSVTMRTLRG